MKPNIKLTKIFNDGTTITVKDNSYNISVLPDKIVLEIGLLNKDKDKIILTDLSSPSINNFFNNDDEVIINSFSLGKTDVDSYLLKIESGVIEVTYSSFNNLNNTPVQVQESKIILPFPVYELEKYSVVLVNDNVYHIDKKNSYENVLQLKENTLINDTVILYVGYTNCNYIVHTLLLNQKIVETLGLSIEYTNGSVDSINKNEIYKNNQKLRDIVLKFKAIEGLKKSNDMLKIASVIESLNDELEPSK